MVIVADSSALIALATCQALNLLTKLYHDVKVPQKVYDEVSVTDKPQAKRLIEFLNGRVVEVDTQNLGITASGLGQGEIEAMALYQALSADYLLIDDHRARTIAEANNMKCIGALGVLLLGKQKGHIKSIKPYIQILEVSVIYYSEVLLKKVIELAGE